MSGPETRNSNSRVLSRHAVASTCLIIALWGGNSVAVSFSVDVLPPIAVACVRFSLGLLMMLAWCRVQGTPLRVNKWELRVSAIAGFWLFAQISTFNIGVFWSNSTHAAMFINTFPFFVAGIEHWITKSDRLGKRKLAGMSLACLGVLAVMFDRGGNTGESFFWGDLILLFSSVLLAIRVVYVGRVVQRMNPGKLMLWHNLVGVLLFASWSVATEDLSAPNLTWPAIWGLLYQGVIISGFCFVVHATLLQTYSASQISVFSFATPIFGVLFSIWLRDEPFTISIAVGAVLVAVGIRAVNL